ncbi:hypothetical protein BUALT_Bualt03G0070100 [Buddleja alternifolia]|uniref:Pentatricopeptide repeat-containing protein n=1 Tax=Buddleja alternifolia TaxID=168488 RepID=A0AAV6XTX6_9LAMI|nr:hypothetical protein BUALT_Bualt03G0070100 [Buddleja alternifolia]
MSTLSRIFHRRYSTTAAFQSQSIKSISDDLYKERDLRRLVDKFKLYSSSDRFRAKAGIYETTVRRLASAKRFRWIREILEHQTQFTYDVSKENFSIRLIKLYGQSGMLENAMEVFDEMPERNCERTVKSMNALLSACVNSRKYEHIDRLFGEMQTKWNVNPDVFSYNIVIKGLCEMGEWERALDKFNAMGGKGVEPDLITFNILLDNLYKNRRFGGAEKIWKQMVVNNLSPNIRSYNARLVGLAKEKKFKEAVESIGEMEKSGIKPDVFTYAALIRGYCDEGNLSEVKKWYGELVRSECVADRTMFESVLLCACEQGDYGWCFELCKELFRKKYLVDAGVLQKVVDKLVKASKIEEAKKVVEMGKFNHYRLYKLNLALEV